MGVPSFFKWLTLKYPKVLIDCLEEKEVKVQGHTIPINLTGPNPNGADFDCLYIDMNGLVHPCCHPEGKAQPKSEHEMMMNVFAEVDRLFAAIRPRKILYLAIDGVAPRAKMNQQRSRRFRSATEARETKEEADKLRKEMLASGLRPPPQGQGPWDSNVIRPALLSWPN
jgi:5'-3' exoribonuclease 2